MTSQCSNIRLPFDSIPESRMLVFEYLEDHLLSLIQQREVPLKQIKRALKWTLDGISQLHAVNITHNDIKPNNILLQTATTFAGLEVKRVLITDLEDAVHLEPGRYLQGATLGNLMWRSPEAHAGGPMEAASDLFAFGIVCIFALTKTIVFAVDNPDLVGDDKVPTILFRQMSYFADDESGVEGLLEYLGDNDEMRDVWEAIVDSCRDVRKNPIMGWQGPGMDDDFKDLVKKLTRLDPRQRISAKEALGHRWFAGFS
ncbi:calcium/calmodulin dependent protein kinase [Zymoseptoria brevis]|uniref:cyclin-dependent kinase n=1 Tax=Zymoseptoria brevis TaxID=1047168 RepID=A0A0F4G7I9_9PEZI|nr:calcium/calmodulin dependent protein kinase [Zymoseptoria brevis]